MLAAWHGTYKLIHFAQKMLFKQLLILIIILALDFRRNLKFTDSYIRPKI